MDLVGILFRQIVIMFLLMFVGGVLFKTGKLTKQGSKDLGTVLIYVIMPCVIIKAYMGGFTEERLKGLLVAFLLAALTLLLSMVVSQIVFRKHPIENFGTAFSNAGFLGIPLVQAMLGEEAVFYVSVFVALLNILQWTYGVFVITKDQKMVSVKKIVTNPVLVSMVIGLLIFGLQIPMPAVISGTVNLVAGMNAPIAMFSLGTYLAQITVRDLFNEKMAYASAAIRLVVIPLLSLAVLSLIPAEYALAKMGMLIVAATPVGSNVAIFAQIHNKDYTRAVKSVCLSTVLSIITLPSIIALAVYLW